MQINNNRQANFYPLVPTEPRNNARLPVTFDAAAEYTATIVDKEQADTTNVVVPLASTQDSQQAQFVRQFIGTERDSSSPERQNNLLPKSVQQYLYIKDMNNDSKPSGGQLVDEMV